MIRCCNVTTVKFALVYDLYKLSEETDVYLDLSNHLWCPVSRAGVRIIFLSSNRGRLLYCLELNHSLDYSVFIQSSYLYQSLLFISKKHIVYVLPCDVFPSMHCNQDVFQIRQFLAYKQQHLCCVATNIVQRCLHNPYSFTDSHVNTFTTVCLYTGVQAVV